MIIETTIPLLGTEVGDIIIASHRNRNEWVVIKLDGKEFVMNAKNLERAIRNATNWGF